MSTENVKGTVHHIARRAQGTQGDVPAECNGRLTPPLEEGPFYKPGSPERTSIAEPGTAGRRLVVEGYVFDRNCRPIKNAWLDFWQTDGNGEYDNAGYKMRGHLFTDQAGRYTLETVVPGLYPGRTAHIHVKVQAPDGPVLTTQIFFPGVSENETDSIFSEQLLATVEDTQNGICKWMFLKQ